MKQHCTICGEQLYGGQDMREHKTKCPGRKNEDTPGVEQMIRDLLKQSQDQGDRVQRLEKALNDILDITEYDASGDMKTITGIIRKVLGNELQA